MIFQSFSFFVFHNSAFFFHETISINSIEFSIRSIELFSKLTKFNEKLIEQIIVHDVETIAQTTTSITIIYNKFDHSRNATIVIFQFVVQNEQKTKRDQINDEFFALLFNIKINFFVFFSLNFE